MICATDELESVNCNELLQVCTACKDNGDFSEDLLDMWRGKTELFTLCLDKSIDSTFTGWQDARLFHSADDVKSKVSTVVEYAESRASEDVRDRCPLLCDRKRDRCSY